MKYKVGDRVKIKSLDWYNENKDEYGYIDCGSRAFFTKMCDLCGQIATIKEVCKYNCYRLEEYDFDWTDEMFEGLVEEETPKFKVNDIVFVKNIGWVIITNSYWDTLANEYIYEAIGFNGEGEYDSINQSNIEYQMAPESIIPHTGGNKITLDEYKNNDKEWLFNKLAMLDNITALESIQDIFNHLQQSKYPKTYEECCTVLRFHYDHYLTYDDEKDINPTKEEEEFIDLMDAFSRLIICRNAYWKIYGEENGLGKPWKPDYKNPDIDLYVIINIYNRVEKAKYGYGFQSCVFTFPTPEMRDDFKKNFDPDIEICKELL